MPEDARPSAHRALPELTPGWVWLVGAGPGDPGLLTRLGHRALECADVILYDALVSPEILALARPAAERLFAGKRAGRISVAQRRVSAALIVHARAGKRVVRLKGGDPFVFGRGAEEAAALARAGVPFRIVPGITAGIGGLAYAGIPVTRRGLNAAVTFVTGHGADGGLPEGLDWQALARPEAVVVFYMALGNLEAITRRLCEAGADAARPVAIVSRASTDDQRVVETTLGAAAGLARRLRIAPPALVVMGEAVRLRHLLAWFDAPSAEVASDVATG